MGQNQVVSGNVVSGKGVITMISTSLIVAFAGPALLAFARPDATPWMYIGAYAVALGAILALRLAVLILVLVVLFLAIVGAVVAQMIGVRR